MEIENLNHKLLCRRSHYFSCLRKYDKKEAGTTIEIEFPSFPQQTCLSFSYTCFCVCIALLGNSDFVTYTLSDVPASEIVNCANFLGSDYLLKFVFNHLLTKKTCASLLVAFANNSGLDTWYCSEICRYIISFTGMSYGRIHDLIAGNGRNYCIRHLTKAIRNHVRTISHFWSHHNPDIKCPCCNLEINHGVAHISENGPVQDVMFLDCCFSIVHYVCGLVITTRMNISNVHPSRSCPVCGTIYRHGFQLWADPEVIQRRNALRQEKGIALNAICPGVVSNVDLNGSVD